MPAFVEAGAPLEDALHALLQTVVARLMKTLMSRGVLIRQMGQTSLACPGPSADGDEARTLRPLHATWWRRWLPGASASAGGW